MRKSLLITGLLIASSFSMACSFVARGPDDYRNDTEALVSTKNADLKRCYDAALVNDANVGGDVVVNFTVEKKTGTIMNPAVDTQEILAEIGARLREERRRDIE